MTVLGHPVLEVEDVSVAYGKRRALEGVSLAVGAGEIVTLLGANGSGKSTTLRAVSGLVRAARGAIRYDGRDVGRWPAARGCCSSTSRPAASTPPRRAR